MRSNISSLNEPLPSKRLIYFQVFTHLYQGCQYLLDAIKGVGKLRQEQKGVMFAVYFLF